MAQLQLRAGLTVVYSRLCLAEGELSEDLLLSLPAKLRRPAALARAREHWRGRHRIQEGINGWPYLKVDAEGNTEYRSLTEFSLVRPHPGLIGLHLKRRIAVYFDRLRPDSFWQSVGAFDLVVRATDGPVASLLHTVGEAENWNVFARPESDGLMWTLKGKPQNTAKGINMQNTQLLSWGRMTGKTTALSQMQGQAASSALILKAQDFIFLDTEASFNQHVMRQTRPVCPNKDQHVQFKILKGRDRITSHWSMRPSAMASILDSLQQIVQEAPEPPPEETPAFVQKAEPSDKRIKPRVLYGPTHKRKHWEK